MDKDDGGSAFPQVESQQVGSQGEYHTEVYSAGGMSLRDYFAAKAMNGLLAQSIGTAIGSDPKIAAEYAYAAADAMLATRKTPNARLKGARAGANEAT